MTILTVTGHALLPVSVLVLVWIAVVFDVAQRRIPNVLTLGAIGVGILSHTVLGGGATAALAGVAVGSVALLPGYLLRTTGAGDVKLMAAAGAFLGPYWVLLAAVFSILVGAVIALGFAVSTVFTRASSAPWQRYGLMLKALTSTGRVYYIAPAAGEVMGRKFPFAIAIALGTTLTLLLWWPAVSTHWAG